MFNSTVMRINAKGRQYEGVAAPTALYKAETWSIGVADSKKLNVMEMICLSRSETVRKNHHVHLRGICTRLFLIKVLNQVTCHFLFHGICHWLTSSDPSFALILKSSSFSHCHFLKPYLFPILNIYIFSLYLIYIHNRRHLTTEVPRIA